MSVNNTEKGRLYFENLISTAVCATSNGALVAGHLIDTDLYKKWEGDDSTSHDITGVLDGTINGFSVCGLCCDDGAKITIEILDGVTSIKKMNAYIDLGRRKELHVNFNFPQSIKGDNYKLTVEGVNPQIRYIIACDAFTDDTFDVGKDLKTQTIDTSEIEYKKTGNISTIEGEKFERFSFAWPALNKQKSLDLMDILKETGQSRLVYFTVSNEEYQGRFSVIGYLKYESMDALVQAAKRYHKIAFEIQGK